MAKQERNALAIVRAPTCFRQRGADIDRLDLIASLLLVAMRHRICDHNSTQFAPVEGFDCISAQNAVRDDGHHFSRAIRHDGIRCLDQSAACVCHVVDEDGNAVLHVANEHHAGNLIGPGSFFMNKCEAEIKAICDGCSSRFRSSAFVTI